MDHFTVPNHTTTTLIDALGTVPDNRSDQGKRHTLGLILSLLLLGFLKGKTSVEACCSFGRYRLSWFTDWFGDLPHGIPNPTTVSRAVGVTSPQAVIGAINHFFTHLITDLETVMSLDGKTIRAIHACKDACMTHMLSLFSQGRVIDQEGVTQKENEITAAPRLLKRQVLLGATITTDALLTQKGVAKAIIDSHGDYLLPVKANHPDLQAIIAPTLTDPLSKVEAASQTECRKTRHITTTISLTKSFDHHALRAEGWAGITWVGKLERQGLRIHKGTRTHIEETVYLIASNPSLTPQQALIINRKHWEIENQLHWQKDYTFNEDRQRIKNQAAPEILAYLRSTAIGLLRQLFDSISKAINQFNEQPLTYKAMLTRLNIV
jgi:predicted transposase YbfD/YdcC